MASSPSASLALLAFASILLGLALAQPPMMGPPFLEGAPADKINEFHQLLLGAGTLTDAQIEAKVKEWVAKQSQDIQTKFAAFEKEQDKAREEGEAAHEAAVKNLSEEAKKADKELSEIAEDKQMTAQEKGTRINALMQGLPAKVREELQSAMAMGGGGPQQPEQFRSPL